MRELCNRCGVVAPTLYHYFGSKEQLFDAVCTEKYRKALITVSQQLPADAPPLEQLDAVCESVFDLLVNDQVLFLLLRRDLVDGSISGRKLRSSEQYAGIISLLREVVAQCCTLGNEDKLAFTTAALIFGYCEFVHVSANIGAIDTDQELGSLRRTLQAAVRKLVTHTS